MQQKKLNEIEAELGKWNFEIPTSGYTLLTKFEKSNTPIGYQISNPERELSILARPNGFQITSEDGKQNRRDFILHYNAITSIALLPSYTVHIRKGLSFFYVILFSLIFFLLGCAFSQKELYLVYTFLGAIFGGIFSLANNKEYRRNLMVSYQDSGTENYMLLSIAKSEWVETIDFFTRFCRDKFSQ